MVDQTVAQAWAMGLTRRGVLVTAAGGASLSLIARSRADDEVDDVVKQLIGRSATESVRIHLTMPRVFPNGYTVPLTLRQPHDRCRSCQAGAGAGAAQSDH
jgi:sulfur-oxidizing protein SoxY